MAPESCVICDDDVDPETDEYGNVDDPHALQTGYDLANDTEDGGGWIVCEHCRHDGATGGDVFVVAWPNPPDDPEASGGEIVTEAATVNGSVLWSLYPGMSTHHEPVEPETDVFDLIAHYVNESSETLPTAFLDQFHDIPDDAEWEQIGTGWHSSLEPSDLSEVINAISRHELGIYGPVLIKHRQTNNVCSHGLTVYAPEGLEVWSKEDHERVPFKEYLARQAGVPAGAFS